LRAEWSSVVAHDLRQPLGAISLNAQMLARATDDPKLLKGIERVRAAANRLNRMVGDLMDLSRLEARRLELVRQRVDVPALVHAAVERVELQAPNRPFEVRLRGDVPEADADPDRIAQVMDNLLTNAVKYGKLGAPIIVSVSRQDGVVEIGVTDEGHALTADELSRLFERFHRTDSAKLQGIQGIGLGLYITRSLVEAHGGRIRAESTPGGVTSFRFTLPVA
jgi:signal transduction histidine kinase